jgi:hypothetical protein
MIASTHVVRMGWLQFVSSRLALMQKGTECHLPLIVLIRLDHPVTIRMRIGSLIAATP